MGNILVQFEFGIMETLIYNDETYMTILKNI